MPGLSIFMAVSTGLVAAGLVSSLWRLITGSNLSIARLNRWRPIMPLVVVALVFSAPLLLMRHETDEYFIRQGALWKLWSSLALAGCLCFIEGVFVITTVARLFSAPV